MTGKSQSIAGSQAAPDAARDWEAVRASSDIQFSPIPKIEPPKPPAWLEALQEFLKNLFEPLGRLLGLSWPVLEKILIALAVLAALYLLIRWLAPLVMRARAAKSTAAPEWSPERGEALALLEDADRLAGEGLFDEATHLLLRRSVQQIAAARPDWLHPASTAREIASLPMLPERARTAFSAIAARVERSLFALRALDAADWQVARDAYTDFALQKLPGQKLPGGGAAA